MHQKVNYLITENNITVNFNGQTHIVSRGDELANKLLQAIKNKNWKAIPDMVSVAKRIEKFSHGNFVVKDGTIYVNDIAVSPVLGNKIIKFSNEGLPYEPLVKFAENLQRNPSYRAVQELYGFLEKNDHPITENGNFIAYKRVRGTFKDIHSNTMDNSPGQVVSMPRNQVNEDSSVTCSHGLHVANWDYAHNHFASSDSLSDVMLEVEVNPADVVAIPADYNNAKIRVCSYKVLRVVDEENSSKTHLRVVDPDNFNAQSPFNDEDNSHKCSRCDGSCEAEYSLCIDCEDEENERNFEDESSSEDEDLDESNSDEEDDVSSDEYPWEDEL